MGMALETVISVEEYLKTSYQPDVDYVDGVLERRNVGHPVHSRVQTNIISQLCRKYPDLVRLDGTQIQCDADPFPCTRYLRDFGQRARG